jgi:hypothetical protein
MIRRCGSKEHQKTGSTFFFRTTRFILSIQLELNKGSKFAYTRTKTDARMRNRPVENHIMFSIAAVINKINQATSRIIYDAK